MVIKINKFDHNGRRHGSWSITSICESGGIDSSYVHGVLQGRFSDFIKNERCRIFFCNLNLEEGELVYYEY